MARRVTALCSLCHSSRPADEVALFSAPRSGQAGRDGNTVGTYICSALDCSIEVGKEPPRSLHNPDPAAVVERRRSELDFRLGRFIDDVR